ncbi:DNA helicase [Pectobacterium phage POP12]|nr:DNA helicase [Pectobacterium phage POP12]
MSLTYEDLSKDQKFAHDRILHNIEKGIKSTLTGGPGVGKTTLVKFIFESLKAKGFSGIMLTAPTHQAKNELAKATGMDTMTVHSALKISPTTLEEVRVFEQKKGKAAPDLSACRLFVIDECSMIDQKLFDIIMRTVPSHAVILCIGDKDQIRPVNVDGMGEISKCFNEDIFDVIVLDTVMRQAEGNPIIKVSREIRDGKPIRSLISDDGTQGIFNSPDVRQFMTSYLSEVKTPDDLIETRMLAYTNDNVDKLNAVIRKHVYKTTEHFVLGEIVVMQEPLVSEQTFQGTKFVEVIFNNGEQVRINQITKRNETLRAAGVSDSLDLTYYVLDVESISEGTTAPIQVVYDKEYIEKLQNYLYYVSAAYKKMKAEGRRAPWNSFWDIKNKFQSIKPLPVCTYHKSQGSTFDNCFMYTPCAIAYADYELCKQLLYVGSTRARFKVNYI